MGVVSILAVAAAWLYGRPKLTIESPQFPAMVQPGVLLDASVTFHNRGLLPLRLGDFSTDCACTVPALEFLTIKGKGTSTLPLKIKVPEGEDAHVFSVFFRSNDFFKKLAKASVDITTEYGVKVLPRRLLMEAQVNGDGGSSGETVKLTVSEGRFDFASVDCAVAGDFLEARVVETAAREAKIVVTAADPVLSGEFNVPLEIRCRLSNGEEHIKKIIVCGLLSDEISVDPPILSMKSNEVRSIAVSGPPAGKPSVVYIGDIEGKIAVDLREYPKIQIMAKDGLENPVTGTVVLSWVESEKRVAFLVGVRSK